MAFFIFIYMAVPKKQKTTSKSKNKNKKILKNFRFKITKFTPSIVVHKFN